MKYRIVGRREWCAGTMKLLYYGQVYKIKHWFWPFPKWYDINSIGRVFIDDVEEQIKRHHADNRVVKEFDL